MCPTVCLFNVLFIYFSVYARTPFSSSVFLALSSYLYIPKYTPTSLMSCYSVFPNPFSLHPFHPAIIKMNKTHTKKRTSPPPPLTSNRPTGKTAHQSPHNARNWATSTPWPKSNKIYLLFSLYPVPAAS